MSTTKEGRKTAIVRENPAGTYVNPTTLLPVDGFDIKQTWDHIDDNSIIGVMFRDVPLQGQSLVVGKLSGSVDVLTIEPLLLWAFGYASSKVHTLPVTGNAEAISIVTLDSVKMPKYAGCFCNTFNLKSSASKGLDFSADVIGWKQEDRASISWPTISIVPGTKLLHRHLSGTGYARIGDQGNDLASGDNVGLDEFSLDIDWKFATQMDNTQQYTLQPLSAGAGKPEVKASFKISRHSADTFLAFRDAGTALQAELYYYVSSSASLLIRIPNFVIDAELTDDDIVRQSIPCFVGRNGIGTTYTNNNTGMTIVSPVQATLDNA